MLVFFFFFKQKTSYEMRISYWSSDVCSSDLGVEETRIFGLIEEAKITRKTFDGRMLDLEITLSDWVYRSVISKNVLTLHRDYFRLRKPFERRMYELARKHCGVKDEWKIGLELLQKKCGSNSPL